MLHDVTERKRAEEKLADVNANLEHLVESLCRFCEQVQGAYGDMTVLPGCELTHVPPRLIPGQIEAARRAFLATGHRVVKLPPQAQDRNVSGRPRAHHPGGARTH